MAGVKVSKGGRVNGHTCFYGRGYVSIGEDTWIGPRCRFYTHPNAEIVIGDNCDIAPEVAFVTGTHEIGSEMRRAGRGYCLPIEVGDGCWIGARTTILGGVHIGKGSVIAAGSVVVGDIPPNALAAGVPARVKRRLER
ncbi:transferase [Candidatus Parcubacteria bacterium]|nr:MAG: transferase [Candidatus Parcubacteria bacterium]